MNVVAAALAALAMHGLAVPAQTVLHLAECPSGGRSCTLRGTHDVYLSPGWRPRDLFHEAGHQVDYWLATDRDRAEFLAVMGDLRAWVSPPNSPHERFAEAFALCALGLGELLREGTGVILGGYGYRPSVPQYDKVCALMRLLSPGAEAPWLPDLAVNVMRVRRVTHKRFVVPRHRIHFV